MSKAARLYENERITNISTLGDDRGQFFTDNLLFFYSLVLNTCFFKFISLVCILKGISK